jgi:hypothetical protein
MITELPISSPSDDASQEPIPGALRLPAEVADMSASGDKSLAAKTADEKKRESVKLMKSYKFGKNALKAKAAQLRGKPLHIEHDRSSGNRRKQP